MDHASVHRVNGVHVRVISPRAIRHRRRVNARSFFLHSLCAHSANGIVAIGKIVRWPRTTRKQHESATKNKAQPAMARNTINTLIFDAGFRCDDDDGFATREKIQTKIIQNGMIETTQHTRRASPDEPLQIVCVCVLCAFINESAHLHLSLVLPARLDMLPQHIDSIELDGGSARLPNEKWKIAQPTIDRLVDWAILVFAWPSEGFTARTECLLGKKHKWRRKQNGLAPVDLGTWNKRMKCTATAKRKTKQIKKNAIHAKE